MSNGVKYMVFDFSGTPIAIELSKVIAVEKIDKILSADKSIILLDLSNNAKVIPIDVNNNSFAKCPDFLNRRVIIVNAKRNKLGILVGSGIEIVSLDHKSIVPMPSLVSTYLSYIKTAALKGGKIILILDVDKFLDTQIAKFGEGICRNSVNIVDIA